MIRRIALALGLIGLPLMACSRGVPVANQEQPEQEQIAKAKPIEQPQPVKVDPPLSKPKPAAKQPEPKPVKNIEPKTEEPKEVEPKKTVDARPPFVPPFPPTFPEPPSEPPAPRKIKQSLIDSTGLVDVELVSAKLADLAYTHRTVSGVGEYTYSGQLIFKVRITNNGQAPVTYTPWHIKEASGSARDEFRKSYSLWFGGIGTKADGGRNDKVEIGSKKFIHDVISFRKPSFEAEEIDIKLSAWNLKKDGDLTFKIGRAFFDDEKARREIIAKKFEAAKVAHAELVIKMKADHEQRVIEAKEEYDTRPMRLELQRLAAIVAEKEAKEKAERLAIEVKAKAERDAAEAKAKADADAKELADRTATLGIFKVEIIKGGSGKIQVHDDIRRFTGPSKESHAWIKLRITNTSDKALRYYDPWCGKDFTLKRDFASLRDDVGNAYPRITFGFSQIPNGQLKSRTRVEPEGSIVDILVFDAPVAKAERFTLTMPGENVGERGVFTLRFQRSFLNSDYDK